MKLLRKLKRLLAFSLAVLMLTTSISYSSLAENSANLIRRKNIFQGYTVYLFGQRHNEMGYYQISGTNPPNPTFCLQPGRRMPNGSAAPFESYTVTKGGTIPGIGPSEKFLPITCAYNWIFYYTDRTNIPYAVVQTYIWGCMAGYDDDWNAQEQAMRQLVPILGDSVMTYYEQMKEFVVREEERFGSSAGLPDWNGTQQRMTLSEGCYTLTLDISTCPALKGAAWVFPDASWSYALADDGNSITFKYNGALEPQGTVYSSELPGTDVQFHAEIFSPPEFQQQVGRLEAELMPAKAEFRVNTDIPWTPEGGGQLELYRHSETFESNYNIDLEKYCAETNQPLEGTVFNVWEDFDFSQINEGGYTEGEPDGTMGEVYLNRMSPEPESDYICDTITTNADGQAGHSDTRYYNYSKTYCMGHPAPDWIECDHDGGDGEDAEDCDCEEENERLREQWMAEQELCALTCDFHVQNDDEDNHNQDTAAMEAMLADRDASYENFIALEYSYHLQEKTARTGYILHGRHNDDKEIETIILTSAQAGGNVEAGSYGAKTASAKLFEPSYTAMRKMDSLRGYTYPVPEGLDMELDEQRSIISVLEENEENPLDELSVKETDGEEKESGISENGETGENGSTEEDTTTDGKEEIDREDGADGGDADGGDQGEGGTGSEDQGEGEIGGEDQGESGVGGGNQEESGTGSGDQGEGGADGGDQGESGTGSVNQAKSGTGNEDQGNGITENAARTISISKAQVNDFPTALRESHHRMIVMSSGAAESNPNAPDKDKSDANEPDTDKSITDTNAPLDKNEKDSNNSNDEELEEVYETYEYVRSPIQPSFETNISFTEQKQEEAGDGNALTRFLISLLSDDDDDSITASLPGFIDDNLDPIDVSAYGNPGNILYTFKIWDHRTEGRIHINKRDLELYKAAPEDSYGQTQGDGTLEGAVYGLFAAQDLIHPDGKSGVIYNQNDVVSVASTDKNGDASFLVFTEKPGTRLVEDGNIKPPDNVTGPENLYNGSSITSSSQGFGTVTYPDYITANGDQWIGRPLLMGNYYIRELSRSEGYELSVEGISLTESNRTQSGITTVREAGQVQVAGGLSDYGNMDADGSWNDFVIENYKTQDGYDIIVSGYPEGTDFYRVDIESRAETVQVVTGSSLQAKLDEQGKPVYQTAKGGEYKTGPDGNPIIKTETATDSSAGQRIPYGETLYYRFRTAPYPGGSAVPGDMSKWGQAVAADYLAEQVNDMLRQIGYKAVADTSPWIDIELTGTTNVQAAEEIMDWYTANNFFDCGAVESIYEKDGTYYARLLYDYSAVSESYPAVYDSVSQKLYIHKTASVDGGPAGEVGYWICYSKGRYSLKSKTVSVKEKREITGTVMYGDDIEAQIDIIYQPVYETYQLGELLLDSAGNPIPVMERLVSYEEREENCQYEKLVLMDAVRDADTGIYTIHVENDVDWSATTAPERTTYRGVTDKKSINHEGQDMPYNQYLTDAAGAGVSVCASVPAMDAGSYIVTRILAYPGQNQPVQDGGTQQKPVQVLQRAIKQSVKITKDISQTSYDDVNTYGFLHNDPLTVLLGLFNNGAGAKGTKILNQFKFKIYLKCNLENIFVDESGNIVSEDIGTAGFKGDVQKIYLPPRDGSGHRLLETKEDGEYNYTKFFDAMYASAQIAKRADTAGIIRQFAIDYYDISAYKKEILAAEPGLNSDVAYDKALEKAENEAMAYLAIFAGLDDRLAIAWDGDPDGGADGDHTTLQCNTKNGKDDYYNNSIMLAYGTYVIAEQTPADIGKELANRHFNKDYPKEITLPFVPDISQDANTGETDVNYQTGSPYYRYNSKDTPEELIGKYKIRFNEENHIIQAHSQDGDFEVYKYGLDRDIVKDHYNGHISQSEDGGTRDGVVYDGYETDSGQLEIRDHVPVMSGMQTAVEGKFASMLVPWTVLSPAVDRINPDTGDVETLAPSGSGSDFNFVAFAQEDFEDAYYSSKLRIEKLDAETGDNIIHDGAIFKIYAAKRDVEKNGTNTVAGTGDVLFGEAVDWKGKPVADADGNQILYPRVGKNAGADDLPVRLDKDGIPRYDESQLIKQEDQDGNETGIFRAYSTIREVVIDGQVKKVPVGYIETYKPLGAGAYVLVEIQAPKGYTKSRPVAFEVYADHVDYYHDQRNQDGTTDGWQPVTALRFRYAVPAAGDANKFQSETVSQIKVQDYPSRIEIHKVEDGDSMTGNENVLQKTDAQGRTELSGGFDGDITVNDAGDMLTYQVRGRKEKLEERGDVRDITYDSGAKEWYGYVTKALDEYSENIIKGTEKELKAMSGVKLLYELDRTFTGKGIRFDIPVSGARLSLYRAIEIEKTGEHSYKGVTVLWENGKAAKIQDTNTGTHDEIRVIGQDSGPAHLDVWDTVKVENDPVNLYFYDLDTVDTQEEPGTGQLFVLDGRGNKLCYADSRTGMAYVYDDYGRMLAYTVDEHGDKELVKSIQVMDDGTGQTIYQNTASADDENGLPVYYSGGSVVTKDESWITGNSTDPYGNPENTGAVHTITRLPFGAYILQEESVPYEQGYIQAKHMGVVVQDTDQVQKYFMQNEFTRTAFAKIDVRTQKEIKGAAMTLYRVQLDKNGKPVKNEDGIYEKGDVYATWMSGCLYDDNGNLMLDEDGQPIPSTEPHWLDHIPVGQYVLEETVCPYEQGYVQSASVNIDVKETGNVQSFEMEDDFTAIDIRKIDSKNRDVIYEDSNAYLTLYRAKLDSEGEPVIQDGIPQYDEMEKIVTFRAATYKDGQDVASTGRVVPDAGGGHPIMKYDYDVKDIPNTYQGRYYYTEQGNVRMEYLPVGSYVLAETENPDGYATAAPILVTIQDKGHLKEIQYAEMEDKPLSLEVSKVNITGGKEVNGARLTIYPVDALGNVSDRPLILHQPTEDGQYQDSTAAWTSGLDGRYTEEDRTAGLIPAGFQVGDLKPHLIEYIPEGDYILREETAPYGFLQSVDVPFTITDTGLLQKAEMVDEIPDGILKITKSDTDRPDQYLKGARFRLENQTMNQVCETVTTDDNGQAQFRPQPIGYMDQDGNFKPYTYVCRETEAAAGHMLTLKPYEFQFEYKNGLTDIIIIEYNPTNDSNRVITDKLLGNTDEMLEGVRLRIERRTDTDWESVEEWVTGKQSHCTKDLQAGEYRLVELQPADGFKLLAEPIEFTITDGISEIPRLIMRNYSTIVEVQKVTSGTGSLLAGARLELIRKDTGQSVRQWTSENTGGQTFYGLEQGSYIIHEIQAPSGYDKAEDKEIIVADNNESIQLFRFENTMESSGGGGGGDNPKPKTEYISFKKTDTTGRVLPGAEFTFYNQEGHVIGTSVSDGSGMFRIKKPADGTYTFKETKAPSGYGLNPDVFSFTVSGSEVIRGTYEVVDQENQIIITKIDGDTGLPLSGAGLRITRAETPESMMFEGVTGADGTITFRPEKSGTYTVKEIKAPEGYSLSDIEYEFTVDEYGNVSGSTTLYNWKEKEPVKRIGRITAFYKVKNRFGTGTFHFGSGSSRKVMTGDDIPVFRMAAAAVICLAGFVICAGKGKRRKWTIRTMAAAVVFFLVLIGLMFPGSVMADDGIERNDRAELGSDIDPWNNATVYFISDEILYPGMEAASPIPQTAWIWAEDGDTGKRREVLLPLTDYHFSNRRWEDGFQMDVTITDYGADGYLAGEELILPQKDILSDAQESFFLDEWKETILNQAGLDPEAYRISRFKWKGPAYEDGGVQCRDLTAIGSRLVADCSATYGGEVNKAVFTEKNTSEPVGKMNLAAVLLPYIPVIAIIVVCVFLYRRIQLQKHWKPNMWGFAAALFLAGFIASMGSLMKAGAAYAGGRGSYDSVRRAAYKNDVQEPQKSTPDVSGNIQMDDESPEQQKIDEKSLALINPEYRLWLSVPGTGIDYPVVQHEDNQYYLTHNFHQEEQISGSIFADCTTVPLAADNTIIYGHNMKDGSMFAGLKKYKEEAFYKENPVIRLFYRGKWLECPILSCQVRNENDAGAYRANLLQEEWASYLKEMQERSVYDTGIVLNGNEKLITLSTCSQKGKRLIVQAIMREE